MKLFGHMITVPVPAKNGHQSMTISSGMPKIPVITLITWMKSSAFHIWHPDWWGKKKLPAESCLLIPGGIRLCRPMVKRKLGIPPRNHWVFCAGSFKLLPIPKRSFWISSQAQAQPGRPVWNLTEHSFWWIAIRNPLKLCASALQVNPSHGWVVMG